MILTIMNEKLISVKVYYGENYENRHFVEFTGPCLPSSEALAWFMSCKNYLYTTITTKVKEDEK